MPLFIPDHEWDSKERMCLFSVHGKGLAGISICRDVELRVRFSLWFFLEVTMDNVTKNLMLDINKKSEEIAKALKKGDVELRKDGMKVKILSVTKKIV